MLAYLEKFNQLPQNIKDKISSPEVMNAVSVIENKYHINLATTLMRIMVDDIKILDLKQFFMFENKLSGPESETLVEELKKTVLVHVGDFLGLDTGKSATEMKAGEEYQVPEKKVKSSSFFFSSEDEEEVMQLTQKLGKISEGGYDEVDEKVEKITKLSDVEFASLELNERFKSLVKTYLKGVRNKVNTREAFLKPIADGGLAIDEKTADKIFELAGLGTEEVIKKEIVPPSKLKVEQPKINQPSDLQSTSQILSDENEESAQVKQEDKDKLEQLVSGGGRDMAYDLSSMPKVEEPKDEAAEEIKVEGVKTFGEVPELEQEEVSGIKLVPEVKLDETNIPDLGSPSELKIPESQGLEPVTQGTKPLEETAQKVEVEVAAPRIIEVKNEEVKPAEDVKSVQSSLGAADESLPRDSKEEPEEKKLDEHIAPRDGQFKPRINVGGSGKIRMEDVKHKPRLVGPVDELANLSTVDYRRLDQDPFRAAAKIKDKIAVLEEDSFAKRVEGLNAWRQSPIHKLYIELGRKSIEQNKPLNQIITETKLEKGDTLNIKEFEAIMDLNKELRF